MKHRPSFTQETCRFGIRLLSVVDRIHLHDFGPAGSGAKPRDVFAMEHGSFFVDETQWSWVMMPPVRLDVAQDIEMNRFVTRRSIWPYMIVEVVGMPLSWAVWIGSIRCAVPIRPGEICWRTSSTEPLPKSREAPTASEADRWCRSKRPRALAPYKTSSGENRECAEWEAFPSTCDKG